MEWIAGIRSMTRMLVLTKMHRPTLALALALVPVACLAGCADQVIDTSGEAGGPCTPGEDACVGDLACEPVAGTDDHVCAAPVVVRGLVVDALADEQPIEGAHVLALDASGSPTGDVAISDADGRYRLEASVPRTADGALVDGQLTLQASAADYAPYPSGLQPAFPVSLADAEPDTDEDEAVVEHAIENASTTIGMIPLPAEELGGATLSGRVEADNAGGTLVVADGGQPRYAVADASGAFTVFNVDAGEYTLEGYRGGLQLDPVPVSVASDDIDGLVLRASESGTGVVNGSVNIVNAPGDLATSVVLVPVALFDPVFEFGPVPTGLRAPDPGLEPDVRSAFTIAGVPAGTYVVLASLENDWLVRDPDTSIAGTELVEVTVGAGETVDIAESFKITEALAVVSPGADAPEAVTGTPTFEFDDDSSEDGYVLVVHDSLGREIWRDDAVPAGMGSANVTVEYAGPELTPGMYYRFQATSFKAGNPEPTSLSRTEDLRGVFVYRP